MGIDKVVLGVVPYEFRYAPGTGQPVCSIRIGPSSVRGYPDLSLLSKLAEDPALSDELARLVAPLRPNTPFRMMRTVRGVLVRLELFQSTVDGPHMELLLDGCDRFTAPKDWETWDDTIKPTTPLEFSN